MSIKLALEIFLLVRHCKPFYDYNTLRYPDRWDSIVQELYPKARIVPKSASMIYMQRVYVISSHPMRRCVLNCVKR